MPWWIGHRYTTALGPVSGGLLQDGGRLSPRQRNVLDENVGRSVRKVRQGNTLHLHMLSVLNGVKVLAELRPLVFILQLDLAQLFVRLGVLLLVQTQDALKGLPQLLPLVFQDFLIKLRLLDRVEFHFIQFLHVTDDLFGIFHLQHSRPHHHPLLLVLLQLPLPRLLSSLVGGVHELPTLGGRCGSPPHVFGVLLRPAPR